MSKKCKVDWSKLVGPLPKTKWLHLEKDDCPVQVCDHDGFLSQRGCRKHVNTKLGWFLYFDEKPELQTDLTESLQTQECLPATSTNDHSFTVLPSFSIFCEIGQVFTKWLTESGGGCKKDRAARQIATRCFKFLKLCCEADEVGCGACFCAGACVCASVGVCSGGAACVCAGVCVAGCFCLCWCLCW